MKKVIKTVQKETESVFLNWPLYGDNGPKPSKWLYSTFTDLKCSKKAPNRFGKETLYFPKVM